MAFIATAVIAVEGAIAVTTVASVAAAVGAVGAAMTVVGVVTKSKELTKIGGFLSIAGGVTSLVNGAVTGLAGAAVEGAASGAASGAADALVSDAATTAADALGGTAASTGASGIVDAANVAGSGFDLTSANFGVDTSLMSGASSPLTTSAADFSGAVKAATPSLAPTAGQTIDDYVASLGTQGVSTPAGAVGSGTSSWLNDWSSKLGDKWDSLSDVTKAELLKAGLSVPGAIQKQKNEEKLLDLNQQKINQTSHGSEVPVFGIIQKAQKGGA